MIKDSSDFTGRPAASTSTATDSNVPNGSVKSVIATLDPSALERPHPNATASHSSANGLGAGPADAAPSLNRTARKILSRQRNPAGPTLFLGNLGFETTSDDIRDMFDRNQRRASEWAPGGNPDAKKESKKKGKGKLAEGEDGADGEGEAAESGSSDDDDDDEDESASGSGDEEQKAEDGDEKKEQKKSKKDRKDRGPLDLSKAKDAGIRKIRLGTFEDSGKCKGCVFLRLSSLRLQAIDPLSRFSATAGPLSISTCPRKRRGHS